jgi:ABC-type transport system involved in multi-copper enzyme maturation permease subunit
MRAFQDVLRFELGLHLRSPLFWGVALLFFGLHLLTLTRTGINLGDNEQIAINSAWLIFQTELVLGVFGMLPAMIFIVTAMTRDTEYRTAELFFTTPVPRAAFLLGRFSAGTLAAFAIGCVGVLGALAGSFMPWLDPARITTFDWRPWIASLTLLVLPNLLVFCALFFCIAALTRSTALTFGAALGTLVLVLVVNLNAVAPVPQWLLLADPFGALPVKEVARYWTVNELNSRLPTALLAPNRAVWLGAALGALLFTLWRYRMELATPRVARTSRRPEIVTTSLVPKAWAGAPQFDTHARLVQFLSQLRMDARGVWQSPLFWVVLAMAAIGIWSEATHLKGAVGNSPLYPATSLMLDFFRFNLFQFVLLAIIYYSGVLVHRERDSGVADISGAAPFPDWIPVTSKVAVLCGVVTSLLVVSMLVSLSVQELADFHDHALGVFLQGMFVYNGCYFWMLCVLAVLVQILSPGKWSGMVTTLLLFVALLALPALHFEHLLYGFRIPYVVHSDMNGFGHYRLQTYTLISYWGAFCVLLLMAGHLLYPRGQHVSWRERLRDAGQRLTPPVLRSCAIAVVVFLSMGVFIFYNTNVLNDYVTVDEAEGAQARYELDYGRYRDAPAPSIVDPKLHVELYAAERSLTSRGTAGLRNNKSHAIVEFVISIDRRSRVDELTVNDATLITKDAAQGFYLFRPDAPLSPGATLTMRWALVRENRGFPNANADNEIIANGSYVRSGLMPVPGYCSECELSSHRERHGLPPAPRLPALGDPAHLDDLWRGIDSRSGFHIVIGTDADQIAVSPGVLQREWQEHGRRYVEYALDGPVWPLMAVQSARYAVSRDYWKGVTLEVYHDPKHAMNVDAMLDTAKKGLSYYNREFAPYRLPSYRMVEYARYRSEVQAGVGTIAYSEGSGFLAQLRDWNYLDYATLHELAHQWWGNVYGARMQGRQLLNEGLAQYSTLMAYKQFADPPITRRILANMHDSYLHARSSETVAELPLLLTEDQGYLSYNKAPLALFALQELIGADKVNGALRSYYARFADMKPPFPTSRDLVNELRAAAGPEHQHLISDLFEKIMLYDVGITAAEVHAVADGYEILLDIAGKQFEASGDGAEHEVPLDTWFQVAVFPASERPLIELQPLYLRHHRLRSGVQQITVRVADKPGTVSVDPFRLMIDRLRDNNSSILTQRAVDGTVRLPEHQQRVDAGRLQVRFSAQQ